MTTRTALAASTALALLALPATAQEMLVFDYSGFEDPSFHQPYVDQHGNSPDFAFFGDEEEAFQKVVAGFSADVTHVCAGSVQKWVEADLVEPWDTSRIGAFADLDANLVGQDVDAGDDTMFLPTDFGSTAIAYTADVPEEAVQTLEVFANPDYAGRVSIPDNVDDAYALAYLATGVTNWQEATDEDFQAASDWLRKIHPNLRTYWVDVAELTQLMATGEVQVSWAWNEVYPAMVEEGYDVGFEREPAEGSSLWLCGYINMKNDTNDDEQLSYDYMNAILDPSVTEALLTSGFGHANRSGMDAFSEEELTAAGLEQIDAPVLAQLPLPVDVREKHSAEFEKIKAGF